MKDTNSVSMFIFIMLASAMVLCSKVGIVIAEPIVSDGAAHQITFVTVTPSAP